MWQALVASIAIAITAYLYSTSNDQPRSQAQGGISPSYDVTKCPGYKLGPVSQAQSGFGFTAPLTLAGEPCHAYGYDIANLTLAVVYEAAHQLHVHVYDSDKQQYQVPLNLVFTRPDSDPEMIQGVTADESHLAFHHTGENETDTSPWAFWIERKATGDVIFDTRPGSIPTYDTPMGSIGVGKSSHRNTTAMPAHDLIFENQYLQLSSALPDDANIYGLGEYYSGSYRRDPDDTLQVMMTLDAQDPIDSNMYGHHPVYMETRSARIVGSLPETHAVAFQNVAGIDILLRRGVIQYRAIGGTLDFRFFSGDTMVRSDAKTTSATLSQALSKTGDPSRGMRAGENATSTQRVNSPNNAIAQYVSYIGRPLMAPMWSYGFHLLRWGYEDISEAKEVVNRMRSADLPLEAQWSDIEYMDTYRDFTSDPQRYSEVELASFIEELTAHHQHWIPIVDGAIPAAPTNSSDVYHPGSRAQELDVLIRNANGTKYIGQVWPGFCFFVDQTATNAQQWYYETYSNFTSTFNLSGLWLDMQEPASFCTGSCGSGANLSDTRPHVADVYIDDWPEGYDNDTWGNTGNITVDGKPTFQPPSSLTAARPSAKTSNKASSEAELRRARAADQDVFTYSDVSTRYLTNPPYAIHNGKGVSEMPLIDNLNQKTVAMEAKAGNGKLDFYDVHNLDGTLMGIHSHAAMSALRPHERPFIVARSTAPGAGQSVHHWLGDNYSTFEYMRKSIQGLLQFQLFGIPMVGSDVCGFNRNSAEELCNRWMMLGAWSPFYRNHNRQGAISQEPFRWDSVANASRIALYKRLEFLPTLYSIMARTSQTGVPAIRSLWYEFPEHFEALKGSDQQYLFGSSILVSGVFEPNVTSIKAIFPSVDGPWRSVYTYEALDVEANKNTTIPAPLSTINVHMRPGSIFLTHARPAYTTTETRAGPYGLLVSLTNSTGSASGDAYVDDGASPLPTPSAELTFRASAGTLVEGWYSGNFTIQQRLDTVVLLGVSSAPEAVHADGDKKLTASFTYDEGLQRLNVTGLGIDLNHDWSLTWV